MEAKIVKDAIVCTGQYTIEGQLVLETECRDFDHFRSLPQVVVYAGRECGKTGWSSDTNRACYKSGVGIAHKVR
jgi:hypothetical protein